MTGKRRAESITVLLCVLYVMGILALHVREMGILAAYLTMPAWYLVAVPVYVVFRAGPNYLGELTGSWGGNLALLFVSAALNAAAVYLAVRGFLGAASARGGSSGASG